MTNKLISIGFIAALFLAGCNSSTGVTTAQVQTATAVACNFVPTAAQLAGTISSIPAADTATAAQIAEAICGALKASGVIAASNPTKAGGARGASAPVIVNVVLPNGSIAVVSGYFTK